MVDGQLVISRTDFPVRDSHAHRQRCIRVAASSRSVLSPPRLSVNWRIEQRVLSNSWAVLQATTAASFSQLSGIVPMEDGSRWRRGWHNPCTPNVTY